MFHKILTPEQLSYVFKINSIVIIAAHLALLLQQYYLPSYKYLESSIEIFDHISFFIVTFIVVSKILSIFIQSNKKLMHQRNLPLLMFEIFLITLTFFLLVITHFIKSDFIKFYSNEALKPVHTVKVISLLFFVAIMFVLELYKSLHEANPPINKKRIKDFLSSEIHIFIRQYFILFISFLGILHFKTLHKFAILALTQTESIGLYFIYTLMVMWILVIIYYFYKIKIHQKK